MARKLQTRLTHIAGKRLSATVNPPLERGSTLLMPDINALYKATPSYGRMGHTVHRELETGLCQLEQAGHARLTPNGLSACALALASFVEAGDHVLIADNIYGPTRRFCTRRLHKMGVRTSFFRYDIGADIESLVEERTRLIYLESPGSLTFDICDTPAIVSVAEKAGLISILDNTWGCGIAFQPLALGVDVSVQALTKYIVGHADALGGAVLSRTPAHAHQINQTAEDWGLSLGPDEAYLALRGLRTLPTRYRVHEAAGLKLAHWLQDHPAIDRVLHPALPEHREHALWLRDFKGSNGLFGLVPKPMNETQKQTFFSSLTLFGFGFSWGGFESLLIPADPKTVRSPDHWMSQAPQDLWRIHVGLEDVEDLICDLDQAFMRAGL